MAVWFMPIGVMRRMPPMLLSWLAGRATYYTLVATREQSSLPGEVERWSLTSLREKVVKIGAKVIAHGRYVIFQMAEVAVPRELFAAILERIRRLRRPEAGVVPSG